mmetsp:Transcript_126924/g.353443  ORF Transcript_126924/g.353443 Transcript_126924/m.353443 type:complete len:200 (-) Transcript_126924:447-1046(-)
MACLTHGGGGGPSLRRGQRGGPGRERGAARVAGRRGPGRERSRGSPSLVHLAGRGLPAGSRGAPRGPSGCYTRACRPPAAGTAHGSCSGQGGGLGDSPLVRWRADGVAHGVGGVPLRRAGRRGRRRPERKAAGPRRMARGQGWGRGRRAHDRFACQQARRPPLTGRCMLGSRCELVALRGLQAALPLRQELRRGRQPLL